MTLRELISAASPLSSQETIRTHLAAINPTLLGYSPDLIVEEIIIQEENSIILLEEDAPIEITEISDDQIIESSEIKISSIEGDRIDGTC